MFSSCLYAMAFIRDTRRMVTMRVHCQKCAKPWLACRHALFNTDLFFLKGKSLLDGIRVHGLFSCLLHMFFAALIVVGPHMPESGYASERWIQKFDGKPSSIILSAPSEWHDICADKLVR